MPVYEFYCSDCHTIFNFLSRRANTDKRPDCPRCGRTELELQVSNFSISKRHGEQTSIDGMPDIDEAKLEKALMGMAGEMDRMDENDPRQMAKIMRKLSEATGMNLGSGFDEAISRLESGENPEKIEEEMGDLLGGQDMADFFSKDGVKVMKRKYALPSHDETLYSME